MSVTLEETKIWYAERGRLGEFCKIYICHGCRYGDACYSLADERRIGCMEYKDAPPEKEPEPWCEMSYRREEQASALLAKKGW